MRRMNWVWFRHRRLRRLASGLDYDTGESIRRSIALLLLLVAAHTAAMMVLENFSAQQAVWLTMTTLATVGYGDYSATTVAGQFATITLLYLVGITILAKLAGEVIDHRLQRRSHMLRGQWRWHMRDHLLIINLSSQADERYLMRLVSQIRKTPEMGAVPVLLLTSEYPDGLPEALRREGVVHRHGYPDSDDTLDDVAPELARAIVVLSNDELDRGADALTFDVVHRLSERIDTGRIPLVIECVDDANRARFRRLGVRAVIRPVHAYPEMVIRALVAPGTERFLENLFTHEGDHSRRYDFPLRGLPWVEVVTRLIRHDMGTALAYVTEDGEVFSNPAANDEIHASALIVLVRASPRPTTKDIERALKD